MTSYMCSCIILVIAAACHMFSVIRIVSGIKCLLDLPGEAREAGEDWIRSDLKMADNNVAGSHRQSYCMR